MTERWICPVCGYPDLDEPPRDRMGYALFGICPCCMVQFGYDDVAPTAEGMTARQAALRAGWIAEGCPWKGVGNPPDGWNGRRQAGLG